MQSSEEQIPTPHGELPVHVVSSTENDGPKPGVIVIHDALGMSTDLKNQAVWLAEVGYFAAAPNLYHWGGRMRCMFSVIKSAIKKKGRVFDEIEALRRWLSKDPRCNGTIGLIGFCMGGGLALTLAPNDGYSAASVNYGGLMKGAEEDLASSCPIVASYGAQDPSLPGVAKKLEGILQKNNIPHDVKEYPDAGHGFMNRHDPEETPWVFSMLARWSKTDYCEGPSEDARRRILAFFNTHLRSVTAIVRHFQPESLWSYQIHNIQRFEQRRILENGSSTKRSPPREN